MFVWTSKMVGTNGFFSRRVRSEKIVVSCIQQLIEPNKNNANIFSTKYKIILTHVFKIVKHLFRLFSSLEAGQLKISPSKKEEYLCTEKLLQTNFF